MGEILSFIHLFEEFRQNNFSNNLGGDRANVLGCSFFLFLCSQLVIKEIFLKRQIILFEHNIHRALDHESFVVLRVDGGFVWNDPYLVERVDGDIGRLEILISFFINFLPEGAAKIILRIDQRGCDLLEDIILG